MRTSIKILLLLVAAPLAACSEGQSTPATTDPPPSTIILDPDTKYPSKLTWKDPGLDGLGGTLYRVEIDGMDCIIWKQRTNGNANNSVGYGGLTCDWPDNAEETDG